MRQFFSFMTFAWNTYISCFFERTYAFMQIFPKKTIHPRSVVRCSFQHPLSSGIVPWIFPQEKPGVCGVPQGLLGMAPGSPRGCTGRANGRGLGTARVDGEWPLDDQMGCGGGFFVDFVGKIIQGNHGTIPLKNGRCLIGKIFTNPGHWIGEREKTKCEFTPANMRI